MTLRQMAQTQRLPQVSQQDVDDLISGTVQQQIDDYALDQLGLVLEDGRRTQLDLPVVRSVTRRRRGHDLASALHSLVAEAAS